MRGWTATRSSISTDTTWVSRYRQSRDSSSRLSGAATTRRSRSLPPRWSGSRSQLARASSSRRSSAARRSRSRAQESSAAYSKRRSSTTPRLRSSASAGLRRDPSRATTTSRFARSAMSRSPSTTVWLTARAPASSGSPLSAAWNRLRPARARSSGAAGKGGKPAARRTVHLVRPSTDGAASCRQRCQPSAEPGFARREQTAARGALGRDVEVLFEHLLDSRLADAAFEPRNSPLPLDQHERRHDVHLEALGQLGLLVHVDPSHLEAFALGSRDVREQALHSPCRS